MNSQTGSNSWKRSVTSVASLVASGALAFGLLAAAPSALAEPAADPSAQAEAPEQLPEDMTADQALAIIAADYDTGAGGGKISNLIHQIMQLRAAGFRASSANRAAIVDALEKRPNQGPLVAALESTLAFQTKSMARAQQAQQSQGQQPTIGFHPGNTGQVMVGGPQLPVG